MTELSKQEEKVCDFLQTVPNGVDMNELQAQTLVPLQDLVQVINNLSVKGHIQFFQTANGILYKWVAVSQQPAISLMEGDERIIYKLIEQTENKGIWTKELKFKSNLHQNLITKILKSLEGKKLIKSVKSIKNPTKKVYMLYDLVPSREVTGGPWFSESELDSEFVDSLMTACYKFVASRSLANELYSANYSGFPSVEQVHDFIVKAGITSAELGMEDVESLLQALVYDGRAERVINGDEICFKAIRTSSSNAFTNVPCGVCPVFRFCSDKGPITPLNCEYLDKWLQF